MGNKTTKPVSSLMDGNTEVSDSMKAMISAFKKGRKYTPVVKEHTPSLKPSALMSEVQRGGTISKMPFAPQPLCIDYSIFDPLESEQLKLNDTILDFSNSKYKSVSLLDSCLGSIYGMLIGDSWGHLLEFVPVQYDKIIIKALDEPNFKAPGVLNRFRLKPGQYTDDSSMGLCLADTLLTKGHVDCIDLRKRFIMWWYLGYNNAFRYDEKSRKTLERKGRSVGLGGQIGFSLKSFLDNPKDMYATGDENMSGNGSIMRLCPLPIFYRNSPLKEVVAESMNQSFTTHSGVQSAECAALLSYFIIAAIKSEAKTGKEFLDATNVEPIMEYLQTNAVKCIASSRQNEDWEVDPYNKVAADQNWNWKEEGHRYSPTRSGLNPGYVGGYACDNIAMALHCIYHSNSFDSAVLRCINRCGDADTVGSVTGQIAGALYGLTDIFPKSLECVMQWDPKGEIPLRIFKMFQDEIGRLQG